MSGFVKEQPLGPNTDVYHVKLHGGLGDQIWVLAALCNADKPIFVDVSNEGRNRPRRTGEFLDHVKCVAGWRYDPLSFVPGADWTSYTHPACAFGKAWEEIKPKPGKILLLECNKWLEAGYPLDTWLPDLPKNHHFEFTDAGPPDIQISKNYVVFHMAGWPDLTDDKWITCMSLYSGICDVYLVGGSYDYRPANVSHKAKARGVKHTLLTDLSWASLSALIKNAQFVFGHASGFMALTNTLKTPGAVSYLKAYPLMTGTWASPDFKDMFFASDEEEFITAAWLGSKIVTGQTASYSWPPTSSAKQLPAVFDSAAAARTLAKQLNPTNMAATAKLAPAVLDGAYDGGQIVNALVIVGQGQELAESKATCLSIARRASKRPLIVDYPNWTAIPDWSTFNYVVAEGALEEVRRAWRVTATSGVMLFSAHDDRAAKLITAPVLPRNVKGLDNWWQASRTSS